MDECRHGAWIAKRDRMGRKIGPYICGYCGKSVESLGGPKKPPDIAELRRMVKDKV